MEVLIVSLAAIALAAFALTYLLNKTFHRHRWLRYLPSALALCVSGYNLIMSFTAPSSGLRDLAHFIYALLYLAAALASLTTAIILDRRAARKAS